MPNHSIEQLQGIASHLGVPGFQSDASQTQLIRAIQRFNNDEQCFATEKRHDCAQLCEWRRDCRKLKAVWLR
ncbi:MAG: hypothetical protein KGZ83_11075 [Sulfuricella sp.]|nr:hypothetical protein [Sulfuricella sp.]